MFCERGATCSGAKRRESLDAPLDQHFLTWEDVDSASWWISALKAGKPLASDAWIFPNAEGGPLDGDNLRRRIFEKALTKAKLRHIRIHDLRHSYATHLVQNGVSLAYVRQQLGHSSIPITVDRYSHWIPDSNRDAVDALDATPARIPGASAAKKTQSKNRRN